MHMHIFYKKKKHFYKKKIHEGNFWHLDCYVYKLFWLK